MTTTEDDGPDPFGSRRLTAALRGSGDYRLARLLEVRPPVQVWLAHQSGVGGVEPWVRVECASQLQEAEADRYLERARATAHLSHPNLVQVFAVGEDPAVAFAVMEHVNGKNLTDVMLRAAERQSPLSPSMIAYILSEVCAAFEYAQRVTSPDGRPLELVHGNLAPREVWVTDRGDVKVGGFFATPVSRPDPFDESTASFLSPEQCLGGSRDARSDVYSVGILAYALFAGASPFEHPSVLATLEGVTRRRAPSLREVAPGVPAALEAVIMRAIEKEPAGRFATAADLGAALRPFIGEPPDQVTATGVAACIHALFPDELAEETRSTPAAGDILMVCPSCDRHVRLGVTTCPFCAGAITEPVSSPRIETMPVAAYGISPIAMDPHDLPHHPILPSDEHAIGWAPRFVVLALALLAAGLAAWFALR